MIAGDLDNFDTRPIRQLAVNQIARLAQCQTKHIETWPEIRYSRRCEYPNTLRHMKLRRLTRRIDYQSGIACFGMAHGAWSN